MEWQPDILGAEFQSLAITAAGPDGVERSATLVRFRPQQDAPTSAAGRRTVLFLRSSGEQRLSNFLLWQSAYAEFVFMDTLWPDVDRRTLWSAVEEYAKRDRRYGGAVDAARP